MELVFGGEEDRDVERGPFDAQGGVVEHEAALGRLAVEVVALVREERVVLEDDEAMREAARNEELLLVLSGQDDAHVLPERRRALADVDRDIPDRAVDDAHELRLGVFARLPVESAHDALRRERLVVLDEVGGDPRRLVPRGVILLAEPSAAVAKRLRLYDLHARD